MKYREDTNYRHPEMIAKYSLFWGVYTYIMQTRTFPEIKEGKYEIDDEYLVKVLPRNQHLVPKDCFKSFRHFLNSKYTRIFNLKSKKTV
jgi:hypothetical protein